jgi:hypothetical protein
MQGIGPLSSSFHEENANGLGFRTIRRLICYASYVVWSLSRYHNRMNNKNEK